MKKIAWFYWNEGWDRAPWFVRCNFLSWTTANPQWQVIFLDDSNLSAYSDAAKLVERNRRYISATAFSDVLRLDLLSHSGGAWVDATVLCRASLDSWLPEVVKPSGFFSFRSGCVDRDLASWHLAAEANNYLVVKWREMAAWYWGEHDFDNPKPWLPILRELEEKYCVNLETTAGFLSKETIDKFRVYPYFWINYLHQRLVRVDAKAENIWSKTPDIFCGPQSTFLQSDPLRPPDAYARGIISNPDILMLKFDRRRMPETPPPGSSLDLLYRPLLARKVLASR